MALFDIFIISFFVFVIGLIFGSFLNSYLYRLDCPSEQRHSFCPKCLHQLYFLELIPVFSFIFLKGRCRYCSQQISWQYPLVELAAGFLFLAFSLFINARFGAPFGFISLIYYWILSLLLIVIAAYDIKHFIILDRALFPAIILTFSYLLFKVFQDNDIFAFLNFIVTAILMAMAFLLIYFLSQGRWLGFGDVKLTFFIGLSLGFPNILPGLFFTFLAGAIIGLGFMLFKNKGLKSQIPFAPFLIAGQLFAIFFGQEAITLYLNLFLGV